MVRAPSRCLSNVLVAKPLLLAKLALLAIGVLAFFTEVLLAQPIAEPLQESITEEGLVERLSNLV